MLHDLETSSWLISRLTMWKEYISLSKLYVKSRNCCLGKQSVASFKSLDWDIHVATLGNILSSVTLPLLCQIILLSTLLSYILSLCASLHLRDQFHTHTEQEIWIKRPGWPSELSYHSRVSNLTTVLIFVVSCIWNNRKSGHSYAVEISVFSNPCFFCRSHYFYVIYINYLFLLFQLTMGLGTHIRSNWHYGPIMLSQRWSQSYWIVSLTQQKMEHLTMIKRMEIPPQNHKYWSIPNLKKLICFIHTNGG